jgi:hypothetical protein
MNNSTEKPRLKNWDSAADHCGVKVGYFRNQTKAGRGPRYLQPSPKVILFREQDLDDWMASWKVVSK